MIIVSNRNNQEKVVIYLCMLILLFIGLIKIQLIEPKNYILRKTTERPVNLSDSVDMNGNEIQELVEFLCFEIIPRITNEIPEIIRNGNAEAVSSDDLYHVHLCYPSQFAFNNKCIDMQRLRDHKEFYLLYHSYERLQRLKEKWKAELKTVSDVSLRLWVTSLEKNPFNYNHFKYYHQKPTSTPEVLSVSELEKFSQIWALHRKKNCKPSEREKLTDKLIVLAGSQQPEYGEAVNRLLARRTTKTIVQNENTVFITQNEVIQDDHWYPLTIYFTGKGQEPELTQLFAEAESRGCDYFLSSSRGRFALPSFLQFRQLHYLYGMQEIVSRRRVGEDDSEFSKVMRSPENYFIMKAQGNYLFAVFVHF